MSTSPVTLDLSKAQPIGSAQGVTLDLSRAVPLSGQQPGTPAEQAFLAKNPDYVYVQKDPSRPNTQEGIYHRSEAALMANDPTMEHHPVDLDFAKRTAQYGAGSAAAIGGAALAAPVIGPAITGTASFATQQAKKHPFIASELIHQAQSIPYVGKYVPRVAEFLPFILGGGGKSAPPEEDIPVSGKGAASSGPPNPELQNGPSSGPPNGSGPQPRFAPVWRDATSRNKPFAGETEPEALHSAPPLEAGAGESLPSSRPSADINPALPGPLQKLLKKPNGNEAWRSRPLAKTNPWDNPPGGDYNRRLLAAQDREGYTSSDPDAFKDPVEGQIASDFAQEGNFARSSELSRQEQANSMDQAKFRRRAEAQFQARGSTKAASREAPNSQDLTPALKESVRRAKAKKAAKSDDLEEGAKIYRQRHGRL